MLHDGNKIIGHARSEESIRLISEHLIKLAEDGDGDSLFCRFSEILHRVEDQEISHRATWNSYIKSISEKGKE